MRRRRKKRRNPSGFWSWAKEHWFLTFLLGLSALGTLEVIVRGRDARVMSLFRSKPPEEDIPLMPVPRDVG